MKNKVTPIEPLAEREIEVMRKDNLAGISLNAVVKDINEQPSARKVFNWLSTKKDKIDRIR